MKGSFEWIDVRCSIFRFAVTSHQLWLLAGVFIAGQLYPGYSHSDQMLSELGAIGSPTAHISPFLNNYPLSVLFAVFGLCVVKAFPDSGIARVSGYLIVVHGLGTFVAGIVPCDFEYPKEAVSINQKLHGAAGGLMFLSLTVANFLGAALPATVRKWVWFKWFSLGTAILSLVFVVPMFKAMQVDSGAGLYQRLNYGVSLLWLLALTYIVRQRLLSQFDVATAHVAT